ncbi:MAG TPA: hypothetical protein VG326_19530 [Tepidisphaeraceae bacterium]|nr:hypothetical protein [Tepidisphaeraceae bacterium]
MAAAAIFCAIAGINADPQAATPSQSAILPPLATAPLPSTRPTVVAVPFRPWMAPARSDREPRMLPGDKRHALHIRPAVDLPPVAEASGELPAEVTMAVEPAIRFISPDPASPPVASIAAHEDSGKPTAQTDPTLNLAPPGALMMTPPPRTASAPLLLLAIPDPSKAPGEIKTPPPQQEDAPASSFDPPAAPTLGAGK